MALAPAGAEGAIPTTIEQIKACLEDDDPDMCGRVKRDRLAAIASESGVKARNEPWVGHVLALSCESLEKRAINEIMTKGHGIYKKQWDKWKLGEGLPPWQNRRGEDAIQDLIYGILMNDLVKLYEGYEVGGEIRVKGLSVRKVCEKIKAEIGIVIIKESYLREQLESRGVVRDLRGQVRRVQNLQVVGSPSTLGPSTPTSLPVASVSRRPRPSPISSTLPSFLPTPIQSTYHSPSVSSRSNPVPATQRAIQPPLLKSASYQNQSKRNKPGNKKPHQKSPQHFGDTGIQSYCPAGGLAHASTSGNEMSYGMGESMPSSFNHRASSGDNFGNAGSPSIAPVQAGDWSTDESAGFADDASQASNHISNAGDNAVSPFSGPTVSFPLPIVRMAEDPYHDALTQKFEEMKLQLFEGMKLQHSESMKLLTRQIDAERTARDDHANEAAKWRNEYESLRKRYESLGRSYESNGKSYEDLTSGYDALELRVKSLTQTTKHLEGLCKNWEHGKISEQTKRERLSEEMETLQQKYHTYDATIQKLSNDNLELQSKVASLQFDKIMQAERIDDLQSSLEKLKAENSELVAEVGRMKDENLMMEKTVETLKQRNVDLQNAADRLQAENTKLRVEVADLLEAKASLDEQVELLESECASLQEESTAPDMNPTQKFHGHLSHLTFDSGIGESPRASGASSRKRQSSLTDEHEKKRHRSLQPLGEDDAAFLPIMSTSDLPFRSGSEGPAQTKDGWI